MVDDSNDEPQRAPHSQQEEHERDKRQLRVGLSHADVARAVRVDGERMRRLEGNAVRAV